MPLTLAKITYFTLAVGATYTFTYLNYNNNDAAAMALTAPPGYYSNTVFTRVETESCCDFCKLRAANLVRMIGNRASSVMVVILCVVMAVFKGGL
jgi:hypothetical protein